MHYELLVLGGGFAGTAAAICAARRGVKTILVDKSGCLGGAPANCLIYPFMPNATTVDGKRTQLSQGLFTEISEELKKAYGCLHEEYLKLIFDRMTKEAGVDVLFHAYLASTKVENGKLVSASFATRSGIIEIEADRFIDASGDGDLAVRSGCPFRLGRPEDKLCQPMTTCFRVINVDVDAFWNDRPRLGKLYAEKRASGEIKNPRGDILVFKYCIDGVLHFNTTRIIKLDPTDPFDVTKAEMEAREQVFEMVDFLKANSPAFKNAVLSEIAPEIGVRESRMIDGEYVLNADEMKACKVFPDGIACGNYDIDIHNPAGSDTSHYYFPDGQFYTIPYRSLVAKGVDNLLVAGRCISCTHEAQASIRIMPIVCTLGEAAGVAAAQSKEQHTVIMRDVDTDALRAKLRENGAFLV